LGVPAASIVVSFRHNCQFFSQRRMDESRQRGAPVRIERVDVEVSLGKFRFQNRGVTPLFM